MKRLLFFMLLLGSSSTFAVGGNQSGVVSTIDVNATGGGIVFTVTGGPKTGGPVCASQGWAIRDETSLAGKQQYAMLLAAQATGKTVTVIGQDSCMRWSLGEDVNEIQVAN